MFGKKKQKCNAGNVIAITLLMAAGIYFAVMGARLHFMCYNWLCTDALLAYIVAVLFFMWGKHMKMVVK
jgi:hypothetical protein